MTKITTLAGIEKDSAEFCKHALQTLHLSCAEKANITVQMLRLDLLHPLVSGNKWMKLQVWKERYHTGNYQGILTKGGPWSNHLHATAYACFLQKIPLKAIVKAPENYTTATLQDLKNWDAELIFTNRGDYYAEENWASLARSLHYLYIPMGGDGEEGIRGVTQWFNEANLPHFDWVFCAVGTGTTMTGIAASKFDCTQLIGVDAGTGDKNLVEKITSITPNSIDKKISLHTASVKFGKITPAIKQFLQEWYHQHGFMLDAIYTAPLCMFAEHLVKTNAIPAGDKVLLIHTGGLQGNRSQPFLQQLIAP